MVNSKNYILFIRENYNIRLFQPSEHPNIYLEMQTKAYKEAKACELQALIRMIEI